MSVTPRGMAIQEAYREYSEGNFIVNRAYQRKLVWSRSEKQSLIDSILHGYPIPLILLATTIDEDGGKTFEILDGMQRLNAIFSYIENAFPVDDRFFDVTQLPRARQRAEAGEFTAVVGKGRVLDAESCAEILEYTLAITEFPATNPASVNEVFGRINSYGRQLSAQERRQAGVTTPFAQFVRELSAELRGDVSPESLDLALMPEISVDTAADPHRYGIRAEDTFWVEHGVIRRDQLKEGEDEQMIADLAISILEDQPFATSRQRLDQYYDPASNESLDINRRLQRYGAESLKAGILATVSILRDILDNAAVGSRRLREVVNPNAGSNPVKTEFYSVFMALFELCVKDNKSPIENAPIVAALENLHDRLHFAASAVRSERREANINVTKGLLSSHFEDKEPPAVQLGSGLLMRFENALRRSKIETPAYECKQGRLNLDGARSENATLLSRLIETACGIANVSPDSSGAIFIGVADNRADADRIGMLDGVVPVTVGDRFVVGVDRELLHAGVDADVYLAQVTSAFRDSQLSEPLKSDILRSIDYIDYRGRSVVCIWIPRQRQVSTLSDMVFTRVGSSTEAATEFSRLQAIQRLFE